MIVNYVDLGKINKISSQKLRSPTANNEGGMIYGEVVPSCGKEETLEEANDLTTSQHPYAWHGINRS